MADTCTLLTFKKTNDHMRREKVVILTLLAAQLPAMYGQAYVTAFEKLSFYPSAIKCANAIFRFTEGTERTEGQRDTFPDLSA